ncbi:MAG: DUF3006 domain-containing protein [Oscillospiraceae bacterium]
MLIVDRIEGEVVICEEEFYEKVALSFTQIRGSVKEGDCLILQDEYYSINVEETARRRKQNALLLEKLLENAL